MRPIGDDQTTELDEKLSLQEILKADNVADILDDNDLGAISQQVKEDYNTDLQSISNRLSHLKEIIGLAMIIAKQKSYPWTGASNIIFPLIANAGIEFGASCYPEIIKDGNVVKGKIIGKDEGEQAMDFDGSPEGTPMIEPEVLPDGSPNPNAGKPIMINVGEKQRRADRVAIAMNWQLMEEQECWESETDKLVHALPVLGDMFRKTYHDPIREMNVSELIFPDKLIVNNGARDIKSAIITQIIELYPNEVMERIRSGFFKEFDFEFDDDSTDGATTAQSINSDLEITNSEGINSQLHVFLEQHRWLDLDQDGFPEPYIVTVHHNSMKVVRIVPRFEKGDIEYNNKKQVKRIKAKHYFTHYKFIPSPDGSFYSLGFGHLLFNLNKGINSSVNQLLDAGHLNITGGGFIARGIKMKGGKVALAPGEWRIVDVGGDDLQRGIVPLPTPQPSQVLFTLIGYLTDAGRQLGSLSDVLSGQLAGNIQATTMISMVEQGLKQFKSIYKRIYKSLKDEFKLLYELNAEYLTQEKYAEILDEPVINVDVKADFDSKDYAICPVADVDAVNNFQRMAVAQFYMTFLQDQFIDPVQLRKRILSSVNAPDLDKLVRAPEPTPDPLVQIEQMKNETKNRELDIMTQEVVGNMEKLRLELQTMEAKIANIHADSMQKEAAAVSTMKGTAMKEQTEAIKVLDNQIDAQVKQVEVEGRRKDAELKHLTEVMKMQSNEQLKIADLELKRAQLDSVRNRQSESAPQTQE